MSKDSAYFTLSDIDGKHGVKKMKQELDKIRGVLSVSVNTQNSRVAVDFDSTGTSREVIEKSIRAMGYTVTDASVDKHIM